MNIKIENLSKQFNQTQVLAPLNLEIQSGEMLALLGPSGSGKTTLLRMIAGLEQCESGKIFFADQDVSKLHVRARKVGFVFQHYALFEHLTVAQNVAFGLDVMPKNQRPNKAQIGKKVSALLEMVQLGHLAARYPAQLSGGQKQRIALARALATEPNVLLLDEPFGALDAQVRVQLRQWLRSLHAELGFTSVFVTHDQEEAFELADRVAILHKGQIQQVDSPTELYRHPANQFVFDFLGHVNVIAGDLENQQLQQQSAYINLPAGAENLRHPSGKLYFRAHELQLCVHPVKGNNLQLKLVSISPIGQEVRIGLEPVNFKSETNWEVVLSHGEHSHLQAKRLDVVYIQPRNAHLFANQEDVPPRALNWQAPQTLAQNYQI